MDFLDPRKKRAHLIRLYIGYALMAIAVGSATIILLYTSFGYGVDRHTGKVIQNGLVFLSSNPSNANISIVDSRGKKQPNAQTDTRLNIPAGDYTVTLSKDGYRDWRRNFTLDGGSVEQLVYPLLFPKDLKTKETELYSTTPALITNSPDRHWILVLKPGSQTDFDVYDANQTDPTPKTVSIPGDLITAGPNQSLKVIEWSTDNKHVLLKHTYADTYEFIMFNEDAPNESVNINKQLSMSPTEAVLYNKDANQLYVYNAQGGVLQRAVIKDKKVTPLLSNVLAFKPHGSDMLEYISSDTLAKDGKVAVRLWNNDNEYTLRELPANTTYLLDLARFNNNWYVVAGAKSDNQVYVYKNPLDVLTKKDSKLTLPARTLRMESPEKVGFSANTRFISVQGGKNFSIYDAEADRQYRFKVDKDFDPSTPASWMDGHRITAVSNGQIIVFDFDGSNLQTLNSAAGGTTPLFDREYSAIYSLADSSQVKGRAALTRTALRVP